MPFQAKGWQCKSLLLVPFVLVGSALVGCSGGVASTSPVQISAADLKQSEVSRAKLFLDAIEKMPEASRQTAAGIPRTATTLKAAAEADPATQQRIVSLGIHLK